MKNYSFILFLVLSLSLFSQTDSVYTGTKPAKKPKDNIDRIPFSDKIFYGGNFNAMFGTYTILTLNPVIGYKVTEKLHVGGGGIFNYYAVRYGSQRISQTFYGAHSFGRFFILENVFAQVQYDYLYQPKINFTQGTLEKGWVDYLLVGGGLRNRIGENAFFIASLMYNVKNRPNQISAYYNPVIQVGIVGAF